MNAIIVSTPFQLGRFAIAHEMITELIHNE